MTRSDVWHRLKRQLRLGHYWIGWGLLVALFLSPWLPPATEYSLPARDERSLWVQIRQSFALDHHLDHPRVRYWLGWYQEHPEAIARYVQEGQPWLYHVYHETRARHVPAEVALLPFIESGYNPRARSASGASGLWQLTQLAASDVQMDTTQAYDPRNDPIEATEAALDYFQWLSDNWYDHDWELMLAVYNAGLGRVNKAIAQTNTRDFFRLPLPNETQHYVPRLLALAAIIEAPDHYGIELPEILDEPTFINIRVSRSIRLAALRSDDLPVEALRQFNPAHDQRIERNQMLHIPLEHVPGVVCALKQHAALAETAAFPCPVLSP